MIDALTKPAVRWTHFFWNYWLYRVPKEAETLLDVCSGRGIVGAMNQIYLGLDSTGIEVHEPSAAFAERYFDRMICREAGEQLESMPDKSFDVVTCFDAIEHFQRDDAHELLRQMERVARRIVFVSSVNWFYQQDEYDGNPYQRHRCLIHSMEMEKRGYTTRGFGYRSKFFGSFLFRVPLRHFETGYLAWKEIA